jgi:hypothetical protein
MYYDPERAKEIWRRVRAKQRPEAEPDPDGRGWVLRHSRAFRMMAWGLAVVPCLLFSLSVAFLVSRPRELPFLMAVLFCVFFTAMVPVSVYFVLAAYRLTVRFDEEGFTLERFLVKSVRAAWAEVQSIRLSSEETELILGKEGGTVKVPVHVDGLGRFGDYLTRLSLIENFPADVRAVIPPLEHSPEQMPAGPAE